MVAGRNPVDGYYRQQNEMIDGFSEMGSTPPPAHLCLLPPAAPFLSPTFPLPSPPYFPRARAAVAGRNPVDGYYRQQNEMIDGFSEMDALSEQLLPPTPSEVREARRQHRNEFMAVQISNGANVCLFIVKIIASIVSGSLAILASTLDSLLDLLCGFILWYTARTMRRTNPYKYPIGKRRMQPLGIIVFACIMASLGFQILLEAVRKLTDSSHSAGLGEKWQVYVGIMLLVILTKFILFLYCRLFSDDIVQAYALDHMMDVVTNTVGLMAAVLAGEYAWWIDPVGAIFPPVPLHPFPLPLAPLHPFPLPLAPLHPFPLPLAPLHPFLLPQLALYTMFNWGNTVRENVRCLTAESNSKAIAPPLPPTTPPSLPTPQLALYTMFNWGNSVRENLALYTMFNWGNTVRENVRSLTGRTAPPAFLQKLTYLCWNHHRAILAIDTVRAYTFGASYFTEVDVVLPEDMPLKEAHDIGEALQNKLERLPEIERAFVHLDYEVSHRPEHHHHLSTFNNKLERLPEIERAFVHLDYEVSHRPEHHHHLSTFNVSNGPSSTSFSSDPRSPPGILAEVLVICYLTASVAMASLDPFFHLTSLPYAILRPPKLRLKLPTFSFPNPMVVYCFVVFSYFLVVSGIVFDMIVEPPGIGGHQDEATGKFVPEVIMAGRLNQQYIIEGLSSGFMLVMGGLGIVLIDWACDKLQTKNMRLVYLGTGLSMVVMSYTMSMVFLRIKMPGYLH
ncbi:unnamed protein product [Closterium sp. Yama58-4]|nr:unnamed protein product [Closterium sp. Yama58-4]